VLDRPGDAEREIHRRRHDLPRLSHLSGLGEPAVVDDGPRRRQRRVQRVGEFLDQFEVLLLLDAAPDRDDELRLADVDIARTDRLEAADGRADRRFVDVDVERLDVGVSGARCGPPLAAANRQRDRFLGHFDGRLDLRAVHLPGGG